MKNKSPSPRKNKRFPAPAVFFRHGWRCNNALAEVFAPQKLQRTKLAWYPQPSRKAKVPLLMPILFAICLCMLFAACKDEPNPPPPGNKPPSITNAGTDLPANTGALTADGLTVNLTGAAADPDGDTLTYQWKCTGYDHGTYVVTGADSVAAGINSGIGGASGNGTAAVTLRKAGTYTFKLSVSDSVNSAVESEPVTVTINPYTDTKNVTVSFPAFTPGSTTLNLTPTYTPADGWGDFVAGDITYTLSDNKGNSNLGNSVSATSGSYVSGDRVTFTQTFVQGNLTVNNSFVGIVMNMSGLKFVALLDMADNDLNTAIPSVTLNLSKTITEVLPPPDAVVSFVSLAASFPAVTVDFSPSVALPSGVTYTLTDDRPTPNTWNSVNGFTGSKCFYI